MTSLRARWLLVLAALGAAGAGFFLAHQLDRAEPRLTSGTWLPQPKVVPQFTLTDTSGRLFTRAGLLGTPALVFFGFTHCPDVCPTTLLKLAQARKAAALPAKGASQPLVHKNKEDSPPLGIPPLAARSLAAGPLAGLQVLFITVDPERDTPGALALYVHAFDPDFIGLTADPGELKKISAQFGVASVRV